MIRIACIFFAVSSVSMALSVAQAAVSGTKKSQSYIGGPAAQTNPVVPPRRGEVVKMGPSGSKPSNR